MTASNADSQNDVIFSTSVSADPNGEIIEYTLSSGVAISYELKTLNLFALNTGEFRERLHP